MGQFAVSSMVCFVDGAPARKEYRRYRVKQVEGINDFATMAEVVARRYRRLVTEQRRLPDLIVIDGGAGQLSAARGSLIELGLEALPIIGLAKQEEEIYTPDGGEPIRLPRHDPSLKLLQAIRDEAHRFAITFHQALRRKRILNSLLDEIPGIGATRKRAILKSFGSVSRLRQHDAAELAHRVPGLGPKLAAEIMARLHRHPPPSPDDPVKES
jgi:excinuclease ABC subunit C